MKNKMVMLKYKYVLSIYSLYLLLKDFDDRRKLLLLDLCSLVTLDFIHDLVHPNRIRLVGSLYENGCSFLSNDSTISNLRSVFWRGAVCLSL